MNFWNTLGIMLLALALAFGVFYWINLMFKKLFPNFKNALKYKVFRFKSRLKLGERHLKMIEQRYSSHNKELAELLNIDLSSYGYP